MCKICSGSYHCSIISAIFQIRITAINFILAINRSLISLCTIPYSSTDKIYVYPKEISDNNKELVANGLAGILNLDLNKTIQSIKEFKGLEHRLEYVGIVDEIIYYNDSISTVPESTINGVEALKDVNTLLVGGNSRGLDLSKLVEYLKGSNIENIICISTTGESIYAELMKHKASIYKVETLEEAVRIAKKVTKKNKICLLSPAASSYNQFKNFEERGKVFKELVLK